MIYQEWALKERVALGDLILMKNPLNWGFIELDKLAIAN